MKGLMKVFSSGLTIFKEWRKVGSLKRATKGSVQKVVQWINSKKGKLLMSVNDTSKQKEV